MSKFKSTPYIEEDPFEGIILRTYPFQENDIILRVLAPIGGKRSIIAKGAAKEKSKFSVNFDVLDSGAFTTRRGKGSMETLVHFKPFRALTKLRSDLNRFIVTTTIVESFDHLTHEDGHDATELYETLGLSLRAVDEAADLKEMLRACYMALHALLQQTGFAILQEDTAPSKKNLLKILDAIEYHSERELLSKATLKGLLDLLK